MHKACYMLTPINFKVNVSELTLRCFILVLRCFFIYNVFFRFLLKLCSCKIMGKTGVKHLSSSKLCEKFVNFFFVVLVKVKPYCIHPCNFAT